MPSGPPACSNHSVPSPTASLPAIHVEDLRKVYTNSTTGPGLSGTLRGLFRPVRSERVAVDGLSFSVAPGERVGFIGVNGAGKSTTIKMLTGILTPTSGTVKVLGRDPHRQRVANAREIGAVFGQRTQLWWDLPLRDSLRLIGRMYEVSPARLQALTEEFTRTLDLGDLLPKAVRTMSLGQKMRAELAATLIHEPRVVYLDEPTIGLDLVAKEVIRAFILAQNRERGTTVFLTTHDMGDIEELAERIIVIDQGQMLFDGPLRTLKARYGAGRILTLDTVGPVGETVLRLPIGATEEARDGHRLTVRLDPDVVGAGAVAAAVMTQLEVRDFTLQEPDLTRVIGRIYAGEQGRA